MTSPLSPEAVAQMVADLDLFSRCGDVGMMDRDMAIDAKATITTLAAANATLRAEQAMLKFDIDKMLTQIEEHNAAWDELRASEAAAMERVTTALEIAQTRHIPDQPAAYGGSELEWAQRQYASLRRDIIAALTPTADKDPK